MSNRESQYVTPRALNYMWYPYSVPLNPFAWQSLHLPTYLSTDWYLCLDKICTYLPNDWYLWDALTYCSSIICIPLIHSPYHILSIDGFQPIVMLNKCFLISLRHNVNLFVFLSVSYHIPLNQFPLTTVSVSFYALFRWVHPSNGFLHLKRLLLV